MKSIQEKVKDIVEVRAFESLVDFTSDPVRTFEGYYFTDATAELMVKWIDNIAGLRTGKGIACALAGYRGVGKSHFLATLGAIISLPELRLRISDPHVAASAQRLMRRHYPLAYVRRGTADTLLDELQEAVTPLLDKEKPTDTLRGLLESAASLGGDLPFVLMVDTAFERGSRVARDDGRFLAEIAEAARDLNIFVAVILDDDIAGADGVNSAIARAFTIDYLDQDHLYKVVNQHVFPKFNQMQPVLHDIYEYFRAVVPGFRWSEQRFSSLYPLHPAILEVAPFVRLYVHDFALLGFASAAAERILGRPANSLIALDEVFDKSERSLRKIEELKEGFAAYDRLNDEVVSKVPVMQRLQAKLVLKALLLLSLDGQGTSAAEIAGSMLIFDETEPQKAVKNVENWIREFAKALPKDIRIDPDEGRGERFAFRLSSRDDLNKALAEKVDAVPPEAITAVLRRFFRERFVDSGISSESDEIRRDWMDCRLDWRGTKRPGRLIWSDPTSPDDPGPEQGIFADWEVTVELTKRPSSSSGDDVSRLRWRPADLRQDEIDIIRRYYILSTDASFRGGIGDEMRASLHSHAVMVDQIVTRIMMEDGRLTFGDLDSKFPDEARTAKNLTDLLSGMLEPVFDSKFPDHPVFTRNLELDDIGPLAADLYSGTRQKLPDVQDRAKAYGVPLGIVRLDEGFYIPESDDALRSLPAAATVLRLIDEAGDVPVDLDTIYAELHKSPHGWTRESQHLMLTALVSQRQVDFITSGGDRINRRSLDLHIVWNDITAVGRALGTVYSASKLLPWAMTITGNRSISSLDGDEQRQVIMGGLRAWLEGWKKLRIIERFNALPDESFNTNIWRLAGDCGRVLGSVADNIRAALDGSIVLEECLNRIADTFSDTQEQFERANSQVAVVDSFILGASKRAEILTYLSTCGFTGVDDLEETREQLYQVVDRSFRSPSDASNCEMDYLWIKFQRDYAEHFAHEHKSFNSTSGFRRRLGEIEQSEDWWKFENLSQLPIFERKPWDTARELRNRMTQLSCTADIDEVLKRRPFCGCSFELSKAIELSELPMRLEEAVASGLKSYAETLSDRKIELAAAVEAVGAAGDSEFNSGVKNFAKRLRESGGEVPLSHFDIGILKSALAPAE